MNSDHCLSCCLNQYCSCEAVVFRPRHSAVSYGSWRTITALHVCTHKCRHCENVWPSRTEAAKKKKPQMKH